MREYPQNIDAERELLGLLIVRPDRLNDIAEILTAEDFYFPAHREIYGTLLEMYRDGQKISLTLLISRLEGKQVLEKIGGASYIAALCPAGFVPDAFLQLAEGLAAEIREKSRARQIISLCEKIAGKCYGHDYETQEELVNELISGCLKISQAKGKNNTLPVQELMLRLADDIRERYRSGSEITGLSTGLIDLDKLLGGLQNGDLITVAGRPSMGKSSLATTILLAAAKAGKTAVIFSTEVDALRLARRLVAQESRVDLHKFRRPKHLKSGEFVRIVEVQNELAKLNIYVNDCPSPTPAYVSAECFKLKAQTGRIDLVIVDYIGLMTWDGRAESRNQELGKISASLKKLARDLECPVVMLSQLNRAVESRQDKKPKLADLRESGAIEQDSDVVIGLYRPEYYDPKDRPGEVEIIVLKSRDGPTGSVWATFLKEYTVFKDKAVV
jgi:replicative DNA helicase